ncbi:hypothetical protein TWF102_002702 [Orbilia oligospora]|uniref:Uncharacterized protein n=1 Tax=Orbilia oligospora TaxID=2813651 RepID=A0A7C8NQY3_ORBOL|nr:hypothetical protein TWF102_002702 [Orbilia oligospora]KAF3116141.1 hypothetical protein TWF103_009369 [Orbilia oligospora]KAF3136903.1 hypothetical protein TWF703_005223 [Orbilia oligospora]
MAIPIPQDIVKIPRLAQRPKRYRLPQDTLKPEPNLLIFLLKSLKTRYASTPLDPPRNTWTPSPIPGNEISVISPTVSEGSATELCGSDW